MSQNHILKVLRNAHGNYVSGEEISNQLQLTRAAVWKSISALRKDGYVIEAHSGRGYRLAEVPDVLSVGEITSYLSRTQPVICLDTVDSTNNYLKKAALEQAADRTVVVADSQSAGRGRMSRSFQSPAGKGLYLSYLMRPSTAPAQLISVTALCAVAVCNAIERVCGVRPNIKWVNDLVLNRKKLCGILTELSIEGESGRLQYVIMGIGINVHQEKEDYPAELAQTATSLDIELGGNVSRAKLAAAMIEELDKLYIGLEGDHADYLSYYRRDCVTLGKEVLIISGSSEERAFALDVDDVFGLIVRHQDGSVTTVNSGEVSVRGLYGYLPEN